MQYLFERLDAAPFDLQAAVQAQLERIVSARAADSAGAPAFGMPSVVELGAGDRTALAGYAARLARMVRRYEPRLRGASVTLEAGDGGLMPYALVISGTLADSGEAQRYRFALHARGTP